MKKLLTLFLLLACCITVHAQKYHNRSSTNIIRTKIDSALSARETENSIFGSVELFIDKDGYVKSCTRFGGTDDEFTPFVSKINELLTKFNFKVEPFVKDGVNYPSTALISVSIFPFKNNH